MGLAAPLATLLKRVPKATMAMVKQSYSREEEHSWQLTSPAEISDIS